MMRKLFSLQHTVAVMLATMIALVSLNSCSDDDPKAVGFGEFDVTKTMQLTVGTDSTLTITGNGVYVPTSTDENVATATVTGDKLVVKAISAGDATITVTDKENQTNKFKVTVINKLTVNKETVNIYLGGSATVTILTGNGGYMFEPGIDETIATAEIAGEIITIKSLKEGETGTTSVTIKDKAGETVTIEINIIDNVLAGTKWEDGTASPQASTDYQPATDAILLNINNNPMLGMLSSAKLTFYANGTFKMGIFANGDYRIDDESIILSNVKGFIKDYLKGDIPIPIVGKLEEMTSFDLPMNQTETFNAAKMKEIAEEYGDPKIADAKVEKVVININLKKVIE